jgi:alpha-galactosidase
LSISAVILFPLVIFFSLISMVHLVSAVAIASLAGAAIAANPLKVLKAGTTPNGWKSPPKGWNSFALQANPNVAPNFVLDQNHVLEQCSKMAETLGSAGYKYCSVDSGWSIGDHGDDNGRIVADPSKFNLTWLSGQLHSKNLKLGVYILPGAFCNDQDKIIEGTNIAIKDTFSGNNNGFARCDFDFSKDGVQQWHDSVVKLFAES